MKLLALRGAITCDSDTAEEIDHKTQTLVKEMLGRNDVRPDDVVSVIFTATDDLTARYPAAAARAIGLDVPLLCARELAVHDGMPRVIRALMHVYTDRPRGALHHVYLEDAKQLRDDLPE